MRLDATTHQTVIFKQAINGIKDICPEVKFVFKKDGCTIMCSDNTQSYGLYAKFAADKFEDYHIDGEEIVWGLDMAVVTKMLGSSGCNSIRMYMEDGNYTNAMIEVTDNDNNCVTKNSLPLLEFQEAEFRIRDISANTCVSINSQLFNKKIKDIQHICEKITLKCEGDVLIIDARGDFANQRSEINLECKDIENITDTVYEKTFSIASFIKFTKFSSLSTDINIYLIPDYLLIVEYKVATLGIIRCLIAPLELDDE